MPGPVSDSYDPVWGTADVANDVRDNIRDMDRVLTRLLNNSPPRYILDVIRETDGPPIPNSLCERQLRILRYACRVALEEEDI